MRWLKSERLYILQPNKTSNIIIIVNPPQKKIHFFKFIYYFFIHTHYPPGRYYSILTRKILQWVSFYITYLTYEVISGIISLKTTKSIAPAANESAKGSKQLANWTNKTPRIPATISTNPLNWPYLFKNGLHNIQKTHSQQTKML